MNPFLITDTYELIQTVDKLKRPANFLLDTLFSKELPCSTSTHVYIEYRRGHRRLAPYVVKGNLGVNMSREGTEVRMYTPPCLAPKRTISLADIEMRQFGETPVYSALTPEDRAARMLADDLVFLKSTITNRKAAQAAELVQTGKITIRGLADGANGIVQEDTITFDVPAPLTKNWTNANATIYEDLKDASESVQEMYGEIPTLCICGKNVEAYMLKNNVLKQFLFSSNPTAMAWLNLQPRYTSPQIRTLGFIGALNLTLVSYLETYVDEETGEVKPFIDPDTCIICVPNCGQIVYGAVTLLQNGDWRTYSASEIPFTTSDERSQTASLTLFSRALCLPVDTYAWQTLKVA